MKLNINDFPIGTKINVNYLIPITEYYNGILPNNYNVSFNSSPQFYSTIISCPLLLNKLKIYIYGDKILSLMLNT